MGINRVVVSLYVGSEDVPLSCSIPKAKCTRQRVTAAVSERSVPSVITPRPGKREGRGASVLREGLPITGLDKQLREFCVEWRIGDVEPTSGAAPARNIVRDALPLRPFLSQEVRVGHDKWPKRLAPEGWRKLSRKVAPG